MIKLVLFAPCEKLIVDEDTSMSLVTVLQGLSVSLPKDKAVPKDASALKEWDVVTLWHGNESDLGKKLVQRFSFELPDGTAPFSSKIPFTMTKIWHRNKVHITGMPIAQAGICLMKLWIDEEGKEQEIEPIAVYPIHVTHVPVG